jgi:hypothetical protein
MFNATNGTTKRDQTITINNTEIEPLGDGGGM